MRKTLVLYMFVTLVIINTDGQCHMILKPKGRKCTKELKSH